MIDVKDRVPTYPGRVKLTPVSGQANTYDMQRADVPIVGGTPINKALLDALQARDMVIEYGTYTGDGSNNKQIPTNMAHPLYIVLGNSSGNTNITLLYDIANNDGAMLRWANSGIKSRASVYASVTVNGSIVTVGKGTNAVSYHNTSGTEYHYWIAGRDI